MTRVLALAALVAGPCGAAAVVQRPSLEPPSGGAPDVPALVRDLEAQVDQARQSMREDVASAQGARNQTRGLWAQAKAEKQEHAALLDRLGAKSEEAQKEHEEIAARLVAMGQSTESSVSDLDSQLEIQASRNSELARRLATQPGTQPQGRAKFQADTARLAARQARARDQLAQARDRRRVLVDKIAKLGEELPLMQGKLEEAGQQHDKLVHTVEMLDKSVDEELRNQKGVTQTLANLTSKLALHASIKRSQAAVERRQQVESALGEIQTQVAAMEAEHRALTKSLRQKRSAFQQRSEQEAGAVRVVRGTTAGISKAYSGLLWHLQGSTRNFFSK